MSLNNTSVTANQVLKVAKELCGYQEVGGLKQSRRIEGRWNASDEERGFKAIYVYLDLRLAGLAEDICEFLECVDAKLPRLRPCYRHLFTFGWLDGKLHYAVKVKSSSHPVRKATWRKMIGGIEASAIPSATGIVPDLLSPRNPGKFPPAFRKPRKEDLFLWIFDGSSELQYTGHRGKAWRAASMNSVIMRYKDETGWDVAKGKAYWVQVKKEDD